MQSFFVSTGVVALAEMGDKTQLLSLVLAARFRRPVPIILGIFAATAVNHAGAGALGAWIMQAVGPLVMRWVLGLGFIAMALWTLVPDKLDEDEANATSKFGVFLATTVAFFLAEMGDKTQIATVALAARYSADFVSVIAGTTFGMMLANVPVVLLGDKVTKRLPITIIHRVAAVIFLVLGIAALMGLGS